MRWFFSSTLACASLLLPAIRADEVVGSLGAGWQPFPSDFVAARNTIYWNGGTFNVGIAEVLTGQNLAAGYINSPHFGRGLEWWGRPTGGGPLATQDLEITFRNYAPYTAARRFIETGSNIEFGWYPAGNPDPAQFRPLLGNPPPPSSSETMWIWPNEPQARRYDPPDSPNYGFYAVVRGVGSSIGEEHRYFTESRFNCEVVQGVCVATGGITQEQHFAVFREPGQSVGYQAFWIALKDAPFSSNGIYIGSVADFNDTVVRVGPELPHWLVSGKWVNTNPATIVPYSGSPTDYGVLQDRGHWYASFGLVNNSGTPWSSASLSLPQTGGILFESDPAVYLNGFRMLSGWAMSYSSNHRSLTVFFQSFQVQPGEYVTIQPKMVTQSGCASPCGWNLSASFNLTPPPELRALVTAKSGPMSNRDWGVTLRNSGLGSARTPRVTGIRLTQTGGPACSASLISLPPPYSDIAAGGSDTRSARLNMAACSPVARFTVQFTYTAADGYTDTYELRNTLP